MIQVLGTIVLCASLSIAAGGQVEGRPRTDRRDVAPAAVPSATDSFSAPPRHLYDHGPSFYEFLLHLLNPNDTDWGAWYEERRAALSATALHNPFFWYCLGLTLAYLVIFAALLKSQSDQERQYDIMGEQMNEVRQYADFTARVAVEAIDKYNTHIELCNRVIEAEAGRPAIGITGSSQITQLQANPTKTHEDVELQRRDKTRLESEGNHAAATDTDRPHGATFSGNTGESNGQGKEPPTATMASHADLVRHINTLQQQLVAEQDKNKRLKGGA